MIGLLLQSGSNIQITFSVSVAIPKRLDLPNAEQ